ncbi:hypothetical protein D9M69_665190 [compost metagenome]
MCYDIAAYKVVEAGKTITTHLEALKRREAKIFVIVAKETVFSTQFQHQVTGNTLVPVSSEFILMIFYPFIFLTGRHRAVIIIAECRYRWGKCQAQHDVGTGTRIDRLVNCISGQC